MVKKLNIKEYIQNKGIVCPVCLSSDIEGGQRDFEEDAIMTQSIKCLMCSSTWEDFYILKKYKNLVISKKNEC